MTTLYMKPRELQAERWTGSNQGEVETLTEGMGPTQAGKPSGGARFTLKTMRPGQEPEKTYDLKVWNGRNWIDVPIGWWVVVMEDGNLARMSPDYAAMYCEEDITPPLRHYYEAYRAARDRLERVSLGMETLALQVASVHGHPNLGRHIQDRIRQLLCTHPQSALRYGAAQVWCSICTLRLEPGDIDSRSKEVMAHVVTWCKCDTRDCAVHHGVNDELPPPTIVVPAIPEARRAPLLLPAGELVQFDIREIQDDLG